LEVVQVTTTNDLRVEVTAEDIAAGDAIDGSEPVRLALARLTGQSVDIDLDGDDGYVATIGEGDWTIVVDLPAAANDFLDARWSGDARGEPFGFDLPVPTWLADLIRIHPTERPDALDAAAAGDGMTSRQLDGITAEEERRRRVRAAAYRGLRGMPAVRPVVTRDDLEERWRSVMVGDDTEVYGELAGAVGLLIRIVAGQATPIERTGENDPLNDVTAAEEAVHDQALTDAIRDLIIDRIMAAGVAR
jgi:hypothetical protein